MNMCSSDSVKIRIKDAVSSDLALRVTADYFFDSIESNKHRNILIDFSEVKSISRSFAQEYTKRMTRSRKCIENSNVPENVQKMFRVIENQNDKKMFLDRFDIKFICV